ncbi:MAG: hypothetical protein U0703_10620 [Anaerolineae bacterium]
MTKLLARPDFSLELVQDADCWSFTARLGDSVTQPSQPLDGLRANSAGADTLSGEGDHFRWETQIAPLAGGFILETTLHADAPVELSPAMILWLGALDNMDDRQAHTWRQTIVRAPTTNQQGLGGNDLPACYLYDHATRTETICYFPPDRFAWAAQRFYDFTMREVMIYRPEGRYGIGLIPSSTDHDVCVSGGGASFRLVVHPAPPRNRADHVGSAAPTDRGGRGAARPAADANCGRAPWREMAQNTLKDLRSPELLDRYRWAKRAAGVCTRQLRAQARRSARLRADDTA